MQTKIALAGGGGAEDSRPIDELFASWLGPKGSLLYWPIALRGIRSYESCWAWITATFAPLNITRITMWTELPGHQARELDEFDALYIGGGNTFSLLAQLLESGFDRALTAYARDGKPIYGGSAGAVLLGRDIRTVSHLDRNDIGLRQTEGVDLVGGHAVWVHYRPHEDNLIEAHVMKHQQPVLAIPERSGVAIESAGMRRVGFEPAYCFSTNGKSQV
jgi:dipeptidase E